MSECKHEKYDALLHSYCPDCGMACSVVEIELLRAEYKRLRSEVNERAASEIAYADEIREMRAEIERLREALRFYADPGSVKPNGQWNQDYPGGITYDKNGLSYIDDGDIAREALRIKR